MTDGWHEGWVLEVYNPIGSTQWRESSYNPPTPTLRAVLRAFHHVSTLDPDEEPLVYRARHAASGHTIPLVG